MSEDKKVNRKALIISIAIPLLTGGLSGFLSREGMKTFEQIRQPPLSPPQWLFPVVWTILYVCMGTASYLVFVSDEDKEKIREALFIYGIQLLVNFFWPIFFFNKSWYLFSFLWLVFLWLLIGKTIQLFSAISKKAAYLLVPYFMWVTFAGYLNLAIYFLNRKG